MKYFIFQLNEERFKVLSQSLNKKQLIKLSNQILLLQHQIQKLKNVILELKVQLCQKLESKKIKANCFMSYKPNKNQQQIASSMIRQVIEQNKDNQIEFETLLTRLHQYTQEDIYDLSPLIEHIDNYFNYQFPEQRKKVAQDNNKKIHLVYSYPLEFEKDAITNDIIQFPFFLFENDTLLMPTQFQDQQTFLRNVLENKQKIKLERIEQNIPILRIFSLYQYLIRMNYQTKINIYPQLCNYAVFIDGKQYFYNEEHQMQFFFRNQRHDSNQLINLVNQKKFGKIELFEVSQDQLVDSIVMINIHDNFTQRITQNYTKLWNIDKYTQEIDVNYQDLEQPILLKIISEYQEQLQNKFKNYEDNLIWISKKPYQYIFSTECYDITTPFRHQLDIQYDLLDNYQGRVIKQIVCKDCNTQIIDYSTIFVEEKFYKFYQQTQNKFKQQQHNLHPFLFIFPLQLEKLEQKCKQNIWWKLMLQFNNCPLINYYYLFNIIDYNEDIGIEMQYQKNDQIQYCLHDDERFTLEGTFEKRYWEPEEDQFVLNNQLSKQ